MTDFTNLISQAKKMQEKMKETQDILKKIEVDFPGFGKFKPCIFGHPEAITFPYHFKEIKNSL